MCHTHQPMLPDTITHALNITTYLVCIYVPLLIIARLDGAEEEDHLELRARLDAAGKRLCDNLYPKETCEVIATLEKQHVMTADLLRETMERLEAAERKRTVLQTNLDARCAAAKEHATGLLEGEQTLQAALDDVVKEPNEQQLFSGVAHNNTHQTTMMTTACVRCRTAMCGAPHSVQARPQNTTTTKTEVAPTNMVVQC